MAQWKSVRDFARGIVRIGKMEPEDVAEGNLWFDESDPRYAAKDPHSYDAHDYGKHPEFEDVGWRVQSGLVNVGHSDFNNDPEKARNYAEAYNHAGLYFPNGEYDLGTKQLRINDSSIQSIICQSRLGVVVKSEADSPGCLRIDDSGVSVYGGSWILEIPEPSGNRHALTVRGPRCEIINALAYIDVEQNVDSNTRNGIEFNSAFDGNQSVVRGCIGLRSQRIEDTGVSGDGINVQTNELIVTNNASSSINDEATNSVVANNIQGLDPHDYIDARW